MMYDTLGCAKEANSPFRCINYTDTVTLGYDFTDSLQWLHRYFPGARKQNMNDVMNQHLPQVRHTLSFHYTTKYIIKRNVKVISILHLTPWCSTKSLDLSTDNGITCISQKKEVKDDPTSTGRYMINIMAPLTYFYT